MFDLKLTSSEISGSTCAVSWCVDEETLKYLSDNKVADPQVVLVVAPEGRQYHISKEYRKVVPLKDLMAYLEFHTSGPNKIWGFISIFDTNSAKDYYTSRRSGNFKTSVLNYDGSDYTSDFKLENDETNKFVVSQPQPVVVPTDVFASEPWEWEKTWVNHFFREKPVDQCDFRRRRLVAYSVQPLIVLGDLVLRSLVLALGLLFGARNVSAKYILSPLTYSLNESLEVCCGGSVFIRHLREDEYGNWKPRPLEMLWYGIRSFWALPLMPLLLIPIVLLSIHHLWGVFMVGGLISLVICTVAMGVSYFISGSFTDTVEWFRSLGGTKEEETLWYLDQGEMELLTCKPDRAGFNFKNLPARKKTMYLRFQDLKSKVCKPYSG
jgi:hypothetical protein